MVNDESRAGGLAYVINRYHPSPPTATSCHTCNHKVMSHRSYFHLYARVGHYRSEVTAERNELLIAKNHPTSSIDFISIGNFSTAREGLNTLNRFFLVFASQWPVYFFLHTSYDHTSTRLDSTLWNLEWPSTTMTTRARPVPSSSVVIPPWPRNPISHMLPSRITMTRAGYLGCTP